LTAGEYSLGHNVEPDYFAQDQYKELDVNARVLDDVKEVAPRTTETELRNLLGCFLFSEDDVFKRIGVLSGGERNRYALARMLLHPSNFLLLDEPTNHLDIRAKDVLLESLEKFTGTIVFVSHDRYFIEHLASRVFEIAEGEVRVYPGNFADYLWRKQGGAEQVPTLDDVLIGVPPAQPIPMPRRVPAKRINPIKLKQMQEQAKELEDRIAELEAGIQQSELALSDFVGATEATRLSSLLETQRTELNQAMNQWEQLTHEIEATA
ncbi:MAG: ABC-F family ATP-binding cassette domain-containing protein, partial [Acidobacteriaceae bacterium]|nr:ABC-F family ATP-binding cassette domain-containing protein [Acidobacteriaceae bacterium]